jgi:hypothetical protein
VAHLQAQQGLSLATVQDAEGWAHSHRHRQHRQVFFAGRIGKARIRERRSGCRSFARFGRVEVEPGSTGYEILTRSGNVEQPVRGWSDWQPLQDGSVASPPGRFLQWKAVLHRTARWAAWASIICL